MKYIINNTGIVFFHQNKPIKIDKSSHQYLRIIKAFDLPESEQEAAIFEILDQSAGSHFRVKIGRPAAVRRSNPELQVMEILVNGLAETQAAQALVG